MAPTTRRGASQNVQTASVICAAPPSAQAERYRLRKSQPEVCSRVYLCFVFTLTSFYEQFVPVITKTRKNAKHRAVPINAAAAVADPVSGVVTPDFAMSDLPVAPVSLATSEPAVLCVVADTLSESVFEDPQNTVELGPLAVDLLLHDSIPESSHGPDHGVCFFFLVFFGVFFFYCTLQFAWFF